MQNCSIRAWGEFLSHFVFKDINGDGVDEAVVFYGDEGSESKNKYVRVALLAQEDGKWAVLWDEEGLGTEVEAVSFSSMYGPDTATLIVGYASANLKDKFLAVYTYKEDEHTMQKVDERSYSEYALADFTGSGTDDLVVLSSLTQPGPMEVSLLTVRDGELQPVTSLSLDSLLQDWRRHLYQPLQRAVQPGGGRQHLRRHPCQRAVLF